MRCAAFGSTSWTFSDPQGSVRDWFSPTWSTLNWHHVDYDAFGKPVMAGTSGEQEFFRANGLRYLYAGQYYDVATGLQYSRARYYSPITHRFISQDPLSFAAGDTNLYRRVFNSPTNATDPTGNFVSWVSGAIGAVVGVGTYTIGSWITGNKMTEGGLWGAAASGFVVGAAVGALSGDVSASLVTMTLAGAGGGAINSIVQQGIDNKGRIDLTQVGISTLAGAVGGAFGGAAAGSILARGGSQFMAAMGGGISGGISGGAVGGGLSAAANNQSILAGMWQGAWQGGVYGAVGGALGYAGFRADRGAKQWLNDHPTWNLRNYSIKFDRAATSMNGLGGVSLRYRLGNSKSSPIPESYIDTEHVIDMRSAPAGSRTNAAGFPRDFRWFWRQMLSKFPKLFSPRNVTEIRLGKAPFVDEQWVAGNPTHQSFMGAPLRHHHIDQGPFASGLPNVIHENWHGTLHPK